MGDLPAEISDPRERPAGDKGNEEIQNREAPGERPSFPAGREPEQRQDPGEPSQEESQLARVLVAFEIGIPRSERRFERFFRRFPTQVRDSRRKTRQHQHSECHLLHYPAPAQQRDGKQDRPEYDSQDWDVGHHEVDVRSVHENQPVGGASSISGALERTCESRMKVPVTRSA